MTRTLHLIALAEAPEDDVGVRYDFRLLIPGQAQDQDDGSAQWSLDL